jgi:hypothetical protein
MNVRDQRMFTFRMANQGGGKQNEIIRKINEQEGGGGEDDEKRKFTHFAYRSGIFCQMFLQSALRQSNICCR